MISVFPYKNRLSTYRDRYINAYSLGLDTIADWLRAGPTNDHLTPSRKALTERCIELSGIQYWHFVNSGSSALQAAVSVLSEPNDKIIMPAWGFIATPQNVLWLNRRIVFCDNGIDGLMCLKSLALALEQHPDTKIVMPVHLLGRTQDISKIRQIVPKHIHIVEDAANSFYMPGDNCEIPGTYSDIACFSFDLAKSPGATGTGGALASKSSDLINLVKEKTQQGYNKNRSGFVTPAFKSTLDDTAARIIVEDINIMIENKIRTIRKNNHKLFEENIHQEQLAGKNTMCLAFCFFPKKSSAIEARKIFLENDIQVYAAGAYPCFPELDVFSSLTSVGHTYAKRIADELIIAPVHEFLNEKDKETIIKIANQL